MIVGKVSICLRCHAGASCHFGHTGESQYPFARLDSDFRQNDTKGVPE